MKHHHFKSMCSLHTIENLQKGKEENIAYKLTKLLLKSYDSTLD